MSLGAFVGICNECGKPGHKAFECPKKNKGKSGDNERQQQGKSRDKCGNCGRQGHKDEMCWEKSENADKIPKWLKDKRAAKGEVGAKAADSGSKVEFMLCGITRFAFPQSQDMLQDANIWIADSAATVHTTAHKRGIHSLKAATDADSITMGNGIAEQASLAGKLMGTKMVKKLERLRYRMWFTCRLDSLICSVSPR